MSQTDVQKIMLSSDQAKLTAFRRILTLLEQTTQSAITFLMNQAAKQPPVYKELTHSIRLFRNMMTTMDENIRLTKPNLVHSKAKTQLSHCLTCLQSKQDLRHHAVAAMSEAVEAQALSPDLIRRYQSIFDEAEQLTPKITIAFTQIYKTLEITLDASEK